ncbi:MAG: amidohydrolase family protein [Pseudomonadales bacterium]|nr:amidohydrolase family protein [Pseudomonadales bacterium]
MNKHLSSFFHVIRFLPAILIGTGLPVWTLAESILITNTTVHTQTESGVVSDVSVLVQDGRVTVISPNTVDTLPDDVRIVNGEGMVLTPSLISAYSQLGLDEIDLEASTVDSLLDPLIPAVGPAFDVQYAFNARSVVVDVNLVEGVTHTIIAPRPGSDVMAGLGAFANLGKGRVDAAKIAMFGDVGANAAAKIGGSRAAAIGKLRFALENLASFRPRNHNPGTGEYSKRDLIALKSHLDDDRPLVITAHRAVEISQLITLAEDFDLNLVIRGATEAWQVADVLAAADIPVIIDPLSNIPISFKHLGARLDNAALLERQGVRFAIAVPDTHNVRLMRQHAGNAVANGLSWSTGLHAITRATVELFDLDDALGKVEVGKPANFVLWTGDPLEVTTWAHLVVVDGTIVDPSSRQTQLYKRYERLDRPPFQYGYEH